VINNFNICYCVRKLGRPHVCVHMVLQPWHNSFQLTCHITLIRHSQTVGRRPSCITQLCKIWVAHSSSSIDEYSSPLRCDAVLIGKLPTFWMSLLPPTLKVETASSSKMSIPICQSTRYHIPEAEPSLFGCSAVPSCFSPLIGYNDLWKWQVTDTIFILWLYCHTQHYSKIIQACYWEESNYGASSSANILTKSFGLWLRCILNLYLTLLSSSLGKSVFI